MLIVILSFLVYIGIWYTYMDSSMRAIEKGMEKLEASAYADEVQHKINLMCKGSGAIQVEFKRNATIECKGEKVVVMGNERRVKCEVSCPHTNSSAYSIRKESGKTIISPV